MAFSRPLFIFNPTEGGPYKIMIIIKQSPPPIVLSNPALVDGSLQLRFHDVQEAVEWHERSPR
jgi:hypothetical protein